MVIQQVDLSINFATSKAPGFKWENFNTCSKSPILLEFKDRVSACRSIDEVFAVIRTYTPAIPMNDIEHYGKAIKAFHASVICRTIHINGIEETLEIKRSMFDY